MIWFTSDHHFGHENIIKFVKRPFENAQEMDDEMIKRWNEVVSTKDTVYHLGDFVLGGLDAFMQYALELNGHIKIIPGGHDKRWIKDFVPSEHIEILPQFYMNENILPKQGEYKVSITMCHYPLLSWEQSHYGAPHLHGHTHGTIPVIGESGDLQLPPNQKRGTRLDVGVDTHNFYPYSLGEVLEIVNA